MAAKAIQMELLKQILRLKSEGFSINAIVRHTGLSRPTVKKYLSRIDNAVAAGGDIASLSNKELSRAGYNNDTTCPEGTTLYCPGRALPLRGDRTYKNRCYQAIVMG